tara:strand:+ start:986 stop:1960 length:975 start_codon:yes stop_codon:yes gene_type:complete
MKKFLYNQLILFITKSSILVGGQAVIEGVMMRVPGFIATSVRNPQGDIVTRRREFTSLIHRDKRFNLPIIRGAISLFEAMKIGFSTLQWSADIAFPEEANKQNKLMDFIMTIVSIFFALSLFIFLPLGLTSWFFNAEQDPIIFNILSGAMRISIFLIYLFIISKTKDAKRLFQYHGAEHKVVYAFENGDDLNVDNADKYPTQHPRCGTSFMFIVMLVAIISFIIIDRLFIEIFGSITLFNRFAMHILFIPLVSGLGYEILKFSSQYKDNIILKYFIKPGLWLQNITTNAPDSMQLEVSLDALKSAFGDTLDDYHGKKHIADAIG